MKRGVVAILILIAMFGVASAADCGGSGEHGVKIDGQCYNCGDADLVCPALYGADCGTTSDPDCTFLYWAEKSDGSQAISPLSIITVAGEDTVYLVAVNIGDSGEELDITLKEEDLGTFDADDTIFTDTATVTSGGDIVYPWAISVDDLTTAREDEDNDDFEFYFQVGGKTSSVLNMTIIEAGFCDDAGFTSVCGQYNETYCNSADVCGLAEGGSDSCGTSTPTALPNCNTVIDCYCQWNENTQTCEHIEEPVTEGSGCSAVSNPIPTKLGKCASSQDTDDTCDDGFLTYSWTASWTWDPLNILTETKVDAIIIDVGEGSKVEDPTGSWHYVNSVVSAQKDACSPGSNTIQCPASLKLPFFGVFQFAIATFLILAIYCILAIKRR